MSDHNNSPRGVAEPAIDIGDAYVFPSPSRPGRLVLVMTVFPNAQPGALFSDAASYRFRVRPVAIPAGGPGSRFEVGTDEYDITCAFAAPVTDDAGNSVQEGTCTLPNGAAVSFRVDDEKGAEAPGARVFAGLRMDPLFNDSTGYVETLATRRLAFQANGTNGADGWDILGIVVELDVATMLWRAPGTLFAVAAEVVTAGKFPVRLERFGRAFVKGQMLGEYGADTVNRDLDLRELWNQEDPFELAPNYLGAYRARLNANLAVLDGIDEKIDWPLQPDGSHPLTDLYLGDYQVVDVASRTPRTATSRSSRRRCRGARTRPAVADRSTTTQATRISRSSSREGMARASAMGSTRPRCERRTASPTWRRRIPTRRSPAGPWPPPRSPTNSPFSKQPVWRAAERLEAPRTNPRGSTGGDRLDD